jgi:Prokaryotic membrane lipoprotein lipid attachment site
MRLVFPSPNEIMPKMKKIFILLVLPLALAGCSSSIINLTPSRLARNSDGTYHVEAAWRTSEQTIRPESIKPWVVVGFEKYEMSPELVVRDRWETFVPVPADQKLMHYQFRFDFSRNAISAPVEDCKMSPEFTLEIVDKAAEGK